jgi:site-specific DNA-methyltransferase (adenine-specific)
LPVQTKPDSKVKTAPRPSKPAPDLAGISSELVTTAKLNPFHRNPRIGNVPLIVDSLKAHGQYKPLIGNRGTKTGRPNEVLAGNHLLQAGLQMGLEQMLVHWLDVDDEEAAKIVLVDNRASDKGGYDSELLAGLLVDLDDLTGTGYSDGDLSRLLAGLELGDQDGLTDPDSVPEPPLVPITVPGDVWLLGPHRLVCGDSQFVDVLDAAANGTIIEAMWTDPPYGVDYVGGTKDALKILGDQKAGLSRLLHDSFTAALTVLRPGAPCYVAHADTARIVFETSLNDVGYLVRQNLIWVKNALVLGRSDYHYKHEPILEAEAVGVAEELVDADVSRETLPTEDDLTEGEELQHEPLLYGFTPGGQGRLGRGGPNWYGNNKQTTVFEIPKPPVSREHPTMKPVELIVRMLRNSVVRGGTVLDMFAGSGSTLIACHRLALIAHLVELDPRFCDVICRRYQEHTGVMPILERTKDAVTFLPQGS